MISSNHIKDYLSENIGDSADCLLKDQPEDKQVEFRLRMKIQDK